VGPQPVFIVGVPRSGTTLLAALLGAHSRFDGGPETDFFAFWRGANQRRILADPRWPSRAVAFLATLPAVRGKAHEAFGVGLRELHEFLAPQVARAGLLLEALTQTHARRVGKARWLEKSPIHLAHVADIRRLFPEAPIIRLVRDPRDVALSLQAVPWGARSLLANAYRWQSMDRASAEFFTRDANSRTVLYEQLVARPEDELRRLCAFLGEEFEPGMLDTRRSLRGLSLPGEWWKDRAGTPPDAARAFAWKRGFPRDDLAAVEVVCQEGLDRHGYERGAGATTTHDVYALDAGTVEACADLLRRAAAAGSRFLPLRYGSVAVDCLPADWPGPLVFLGESIPGREPAQRWADLRRLARTLIRRRLAGRTSLRVPGFPGSRGQPDSAARAARALLALGCTPADLLPR
jgi:hypothetical protein